MRVRKNKNNSLRTGFKIAFLIGICMMLVLGLGVLRFHAARLAYYLESVNRSIQKYSDEEVILRQELSALVAPIRIYSYCKESLGMQKVLRAESLPIKFRNGNENIAVKRNSTAENNNWRTRLSWLFGR